METETDTLNVDWKFLVEFGTSEDIFEQKGQDCNARLISVISPTFHVPNLVQIRRNNKRWVS